MSDPFKKWSKTKPLIKPFDGYRRTLPPTGAFKGHREPEESEPEERDSPPKAGPSTSQGFIDPSVLQGNPEGTVDPASHVSKMEELSDLLDKQGTISHEQAISGPIHVIPKGWNVQMEDFLTFEQSVALAEQVDRTLQALGNRPVDPRFFRFYPESLMETGCIQLPPGQTYAQSTLTNDIHAVFAQNNFHATPDHVYEVIKPALRLATMLLTHPAVSSFWHTVEFGVRDADPVADHPFHKHNKRIPNWLTYDEEQARGIAAIWAIIADRVHFRWARFGNTGLESYAYQMYVLDGDKLPANGTRRNSKYYRRQVVSLHTDYYITALRLAETTHRDQAMVLRYHLLLANTLVHELAHVFEADAKAEGGPGGELNPLEEVRLGVEDDSEMGDAWERSVWGGNVRPIGLRVDTPHGMAVDRYSSITHLTHTLWMGLPMSWVLHVQQAETWAAPFDTNVTTHFHPPRSPTNTYSVDVCHCSTEITNHEDLSAIADVLDEMKNNPSFFNGPESIEVDPWTLKFDEQLHARPPTAGGGTVAATPVPPVPPRHPRRDRRSASPEEERRPARSRSIGPRGRRREGDKGSRWKSESPEA